MRILFSLNVRTDLREHINLIWGNSIRKQILDYEGISFMCHRFHATRHLAKNFHLGFTKVLSRKRWNTREEAALDREISPLGKPREILINRVEDLRQPSLSTEKSFETSDHGSNHPLQQDSLHPTGKPLVSSMNNQLIDFHFLDLNASLSATPSLIFSSPNSWIPSPPPPPYATLLPSSCRPSF